ncbi:pseudouridylate synthase 1 homolog isoform X2 [Galleria mellonella]|nr:pseudouridylate synthase 1 homolog isoform X2 [Galleria mellonella]XP_031770469.2 pseudouridylate synthase 1 homolog isoform X2 [Galleria mellonella]
MDVATPEKIDSPKDESDEIIRSKNQTRFKKRHMKRQWEELTANKKDDGESEEKKLCEKTAERIKRKKMAMLLGYCGVDYYGMQRNPGVRTIEEDLLKALYETKYITEDDYKNQQNAHFQRSSRTDKGVSAARQVVSMKLPLEINIDDINKKLPECIRIFAVKRVTNKFNSKSKCNARTYSFTLPTYVFEPSLVTIEERKFYRIPAETLDKVNNVLSIYKGTKSYHNFTERKHFQDPSALRYMMSFSVEKVFVHSDMEFAVLLVKGQSFMLHQIRKMVGLMIAVVRGHTDSSTMERAFGKEKVIIPTAPGLGLVLDMVHYDRYDARYKISHDSLTWEAEEEAVQKFKHDFIYPNIVKGEIEDNSMGNWLEKLNLHSYDPSDDVPGEKETENRELDDDDDEDCDDKETNETKEQDVISKSVENVTSNVASNVESEEKSVESKEVV